MHSASADVSHAYVCGLRLPLSAANGEVLLQAVQCICGKHCSQLDQSTPWL